MVNLLLLVFLATPSYQRELIQLGLEITGLEINACKGDDVLSCVLAHVDLSALDDDILVLPSGVQVTKKKPGLLQDMSDPFHKFPRVVPYECVNVTARFVNMYK